MIFPCCRFCHAPLAQTFVDLGVMPLANSYLNPEDLQKQEPMYSLHARVCGDCFLVQVDSVVPAGEIFEHYAYFSSYSTTWVEHARQFTEMAQERFDLGAESKVVEIASNDGYLLRYFVDRGIPCLGIEPAQNVAATAIEAGIPTEVRFFGQETAGDLVDRGWAADLVIANNVLAHVPDLNDFVAGLKRLVKPTGVISIEFPHLLRLIGEVQFDTIYHEHYSYFSLVSLEKIFAAHGLQLFDVEELATHGGSLRIFAGHADSPQIERQTLQTVRAAEQQAQLDQLEGYAGFQQQVDRVSQQLVQFLQFAKENDKRVAAYGAAAKGNTLLNYCCVTSALIEYVVDRNPHKQGLYLPGSHLPIHPPEHVFETKPDYLLILPWNLASEIQESMQGISQWGGRFVIPIPAAEVLV
jgi:SAM-dependent methyltransferase